MTAKATETRPVRYRTTTRYGASEHTSKRAAIKAARDEARDGWLTVVTDLVTGAEIYRAR